ncbi:hypothetical protein [Streptomyces sp. MST-110588]|uniref:hypothetical protein n=1 Tax=Streptomyces sp. MST-110588 TaxID=2833628 RepID=UPI001F5D0BB8|nr:hypothetical protein [Streptomyces sp. MST-110588]UNO38710.1 hypothetical protein KGS77_02410 [Streptomyces sp. MST-110588]
MAKSQCEEASEDVVLTRIGQAIMLHHGGDREEARNRLSDLWEEVGSRGNPFHRCALAHYLADTQDDPADELAWDLRALEAAERFTWYGDAAASAVGGAPAGEPAAGSLPAGHLPPGDRNAAGDGDSAAGVAASGACAAGHSADGGAGAKPAPGPARGCPATALRAFFPSLHLSLAADYAGLDRHREARAQLGRARRAVDALADDAYGQGLRDAIERLELRIDGAAGHFP